MMVRVYKNYAPVRVVYSVDGKTFKSKLTGDYADIDASTLPDKKYRNYWKWDNDSNSVIVNLEKVEAVNGKKNDKKTILDGIKSKLALNDEEWEALKEYVQKPYSI